MKRNPPKSLAMPKTQLELLMREIKLWGASEDARMGQMIGVFSWSGPENARSRLLAFFFSSFWLRASEIHRQYFLLRRHSVLHCLFPGRSIATTPVSTLPLHLVTSYPKGTGLCYGYSSKQWAWTNFTGGSEALEKKATAAASQGPAGCYTGDWDLQTQK